jgi:hypothetical protein
VVPQPCYVFDHYLSIAAALRFVNSWARTTGLDNRIWLIWYILTY